MELFQFACKLYMIISSLLNGYIEHEGNIKLEIVTELPLDYNLTWNIDKNKDKRCWDSKDNNCFKCPGSSDCPNERR